MEQTPEGLLYDIGLKFQQHGQDLASAITFAELAKKQNDLPKTWCGLGAALAKSAGLFVKEPFWEYSVKSLKRCLTIAEGTQYEGICERWLEILKENVEVDSLDALKDSELDSLLEFIDQDETNLSQAIKLLPEKEQPFALMALGHQRLPRFLPALLAAIKGAFGHDAGRAALQRIGVFGELPEVRKALEEAAKSADGPYLQPEIGYAMSIIDPGWAEEIFTKEIKARSSSEEEAPNL